MVNYLKNLVFYLLMAPFLAMYAFYVTLNILIAAIILVFLAPFLASDDELNPVTVIDFKYNFEDVIWVLRKDIQ